MIDLTAEYFSGLQELHLMVILLISFCCPFLTKPLTASERLGKIGKKGNLIKLSKRLTTNDIYQIEWLLALHFGCTFCPNHYIHKDLLRKI